MRAMIKKGAKWRFTPTWGIPAEILMTLMYPNRNAKPKHEGLGWENVKIKNPMFWNETELMLAHVHATRLAPLGWHHSWAVDVQNGTKIRVLHVFDPF